MLDDVWASVGPPPSSEAVAQTASFRTERLPLIGWGPTGYSERQTPVFMMRSPLVTPSCHERLSAEVGWINYIAYLCYHIIVPCQLELGG